MTLKVRTIAAALVAGTLLCVAACGGGGNSAGTADGGDAGGGARGSLGGSSNGGTSTGGALSSRGGAGGSTPFGSSGATGVSGSNSAASGAGGAGAGGAASIGGSGGMTNGSSGTTSGSAGTSGSGGMTSGSGGMTSGSAGASGSGGMTSGSLGATPPMGWNSWNTFQCNLDEALIKATADSMVSSGMAAAGYEYVNLDDCWMNGRDSSGTLRWNSTKFPAGIPALAAYVHGKGLKLGIYETPNTSTCVGIYGGVSTAVAVGSLGHESADAKTFASWGVDFLKYDLCQGQRSSFAVMRDALKATGRAIFYSINPGNGANDLCPPSTCSLKLTTTSNMWRIGFDINASWGSVTSLIDQDAPLYSYAGPGHFNDPDMLEVGKGMSANEDRSHFSMWAMLAAPLLAGNDIRSMSSATTTLLTNAEVIAVDQDALGLQGRLVASPGANLQVWSKTLNNTNTRAVALFNRTGAAASITVQWSALGLPAGSATVRDLWSHSDLGTFNGSYTAAAVPSHGVVMLKIASTP